MDGARQDCVPVLDREVRREQRGTAQVQVPRGYPLQQRRGLSCGTRHRDAPGLEGLPKGFQDLPLELGQFVQEQDPFVSQ